MKFLGDLFKDISDFDFTLKGAKKFASDHPAATVVLGAGLAIGGAALFGAFTAPAAGVAGAAAMPAGVPAIAAAEGAGFLAAAPAASSGSGITGAIGKYLLSPGGKQLTGLGLATVGSYMSQRESEKAAMEEEERARNFQREMFERTRQARQISYTPAPVRRTVQRGAIAARQASPKPITMTPGEAYGYRKVGRV